MKGKTNMLKRFMGICLAAIMLAATVSAAEDTAREEVAYGKPQSLGYTLTAAYTERSLTTLEDGKPITCVSASTTEGAIINVVDLDDEKLLRTFKMKFSGYMYFGAVNHETHIVYMGIGNHLVEYNPETKNVTDLGRVPTTNSGNVNWAAIDYETGNVWGAASVYSGIWKFDVKTRQLSTFKTMVEGDTKGIGGIDILNGYLYVRGQNSDRKECLAKINKDNADDVTYYDPPSYLTNVTSIGQIYAGGKYIIARIDASEGTWNCIFNTETEKWEDTKFQAHTTSMTDIYDGKFYYLYDQYIHSIDMETLEFEEFPDLKYGSHLRGNGMFVELSDPKMPGYSFITAQYNGNIYALNTQSQKMKKIDVVLVGGPLIHRISRLGNDGRVYVGAFKGSVAAAVNPNTGEKEYFSGDQPEGMFPWKDKMFVGTYAGGDIYMLDTTKPYSLGVHDINSGMNPVKLCTIGEEQNRPFDIDVAEDKILVAVSQPHAGEYGGALTLIDLETYEKHVFRNLVENQSLLTVCTKGNIAYFGTSITSGGNAKPLANNAHVTAFNVDTHEVVRDVELKIPGCAKAIPWVRGLVIGPDGDLYGYTPGGYFVMNPDTLEIKRSNMFDDSQIITDRSDTLQLWHQTQMEFDKRTGYLIVNGTFADPDTLENVLTPPAELKDAMWAGTDDNNMAYFVDTSTTLYKVPMIYGDDKSYLISDMTFLLGNKLYSSGTASDIAVYKENGRTMVPVRLFAAAMGASVNYDAETSTVELTNADGKSLKFITNDNKTVNGNGEVKKIGAVLKEENGVSYLPLPYFAEFCGKETVNGEYGTVFITDKGKNINDNPAALEYIYSELCGEK